MTTAQAAALAPSWPLALAVRRRPRAELPRGGDALQLRASSTCARAASTSPSRSSSARSRRTRRTPTSSKGLGLAYAAKRDWKDAIEQFRKALELNPYYVDVRNDLGTALILAGRPRGGEEGVPHRLRRPDQPDPRDLGPQPGPGLPRGEELRRGDQLVPHQPSAGTRPTPTPTSASPRRSSATGPPRRGGGRSSRRASRRSPAIPACSLALGQVYFRAGRFAEARARLEEAMQQGPRGPGGPRGRGRSSRTCPS